LPSSPNPFLPKGRRGTGFRVRAAKLGCTQGISIKSGKNEKGFDKTITCREK